MRTSSFGYILVGVLLLGVVGCGTDNEEVGQQIGDVMASVDESGGTTGSLAYWEGAKKTFERLAPAEVHDTLLESWFSPTAYAATCSSANTFGSCTSNVITRTFGDCTIGGATFSGTVTLTWSSGASSCAMTATTQNVIRVPAFTVTGRRGATLTVSKSGTVGQRLTWSSGSGSSKVFAFSNDGIRRVFTNARGTTMLDYTTQTTSDITVTGTSRTSRVMSGGSLRVTNNSSSVTCDYVPTDVTWVSTCNCPTSGSWAGSCSDGKTTTLTLTGCGTGTLAVGSSSSAMTFDRCYSI
jgi:hypothetical protein